MGASRACILLPVSLLLCAPANPSRAQGWTHDASLGIKLTQTATSECVLGAVPDAKGGAMFIWADPCSLYATLPPVLPRLTFHAARVLRRGDLDTTFPATLPFDPHTEFAPSIKPDSTGGAYILWGDLRGLATTNRDLYAHHVRADGTLDPTWPAQGRALCTAFGPQFTGSQTSDANRGLIAVWVDRRDSVANTSDIYATHLRANGTLDPLWPTNGLAVHAGPAVQTAPYPIEDGAGGALVFWTDARTLANKNDVYGMHVLANGTLDPAWPAAGFVVAGTSASESSPRAVSDGAGGAFVGWLFRPTSISYFRLTHVRANGTLDPAWPAAGIDFDPSAFDVGAAGLLADGHGGVYVVYEDSQLSGFSEVYARHVLVNGSFDAAWPAQPVRVCPSNSNKPLVFTADPNGNESAIAALVPSGTLDVGPGAPAELAFALAGASPARTQTTFALALPAAAHIKLMLFDVAGRDTRRLVDGPRAAGEFRIAWDLRDDTGHAVPAGLYVAVLDAGGLRVERRVLVVR